MTQKISAANFHVATDADGLLANDSIIEAKVGYPSYHYTFSPIILADDPRYGLPFSVVKEYFASFSKEQLELRNVKDIDAPTAVERWPPYRTISQFGLNDIRTKQYIQLLRSLASQKGADSDRIDRIIENYEFYLFLDYADNVEERRLTLFTELLFDIKTAKVGTPIVLPFMCGLGKSTAISELIYHCFKENRQDPTGKKIGLLIVTDSKERMHEYRSLYRKPGEERIFEQYDKGICIMDHDNLKEAYKIQASCPILIMTTQRYQNLSVKEINKYLDTKYVTREAVIIDEHIPLHEVTEINVNTIYQLIGLTATYVNPVNNTSDKKEFISVLQQIEKVFTDTMLDNERFAVTRTTTQLYCYHSPALYHEINIQHFVKLAEIIETQLGGHSNEADDANVSESSIRYSFKKLCRVLVTLMSKGGLHFTVVSHNKSYYRSGVLVDIDHIDVITEPSKPVLILDGTGDLHPDYCHQDWIAMSDRTWFDKRLDMLHLHFVDEGTSALALNSERGKINISNITAWLEKHDMNPSDMLAFVNKKTKANFKGRFRKIEHFGNIKGKNVYADETRIVQIGLNNKSMAHYFMDDLIYHPDKMEAFKAMNRTESSEMAEAFIEAPMEPGDSRSRYLLADIEQNMFRGSVRTLKNIDDMHYYVFCSKENNEPLYELARQRYMPLGATVTFDEASRPKPKHHHREDEYTVTRVVAWIMEQPVGTVFRRKAIVEALNQKFAQDGEEYTPNQIKKAFETRHGQISALVEKIPHSHRFRRIDPDRPSPDETTPVPDQASADEEPDTVKKAKTIPYPAQ